MLSLIALGSRIPPVAIQRVHATRALATVGSRTTADPTRPVTNESGTLRPKTPGRDKNTTTFYVGSWLAAIGAIWYYYYYYHMMTDNLRIEREREREREGSWGNVTDIEGGRAKGRAQEALKSVDSKYQDVKNEAQLKVQSAREQVGQGIEGGKQRFAEGKDQVAQHAAEVHTNTEKRVDAAKSSWWSWLGWGKSQTQEAANDLKRRADDTFEAWNARFEEAKQKAAQKGEDIKQRADETEEDFRNRIAKAIERR
ncbi:hypothetical protein B0F90DRAFT_1763175 [Multifurca ochricompacta]|uniref:Uncharacterized protein n=1 Tax=Multifurca ochricompacta TaxID=376703 RepID=A0AAD4LU55_9AGAM|nr:hypothetical protein B0F90DRAFT_1786744 [Multifurca ochricompacta]KAI0293373.1 hypothetical protein B0F90DRAFT_1763175 [Multifurca ochricompacta]